MKRILNLIKSHKISSYIKIFIYIPIYIFIYVMKYTNKLITIFYY